VPPSGWARPCMLFAKTTAEKPFRVDKAAL